MPPGEHLLEYLTYTCATFSDRLADRVVTVDVDDTSHLAATLLHEIPGNVPWYMTDSIAVLEDSYSEVIVMSLAVTWKWQLCRETTHDGHKQYWRLFVHL